MALDPAFVLILGAGPVPLLRGRIRAAWMLTLPVAALAVLWSLPEGTHGTVDLFGLVINPLRVDALSRVFATAFSIAALLGIVYSLHVRKPLQQIVTLVYAGAALGGCMAGDLLTLFVFWELAGLSSVALILAGGGERSLKAGQRYLVAQVLSGVLLLAGIAMRVADGHGIAFDSIGVDSLSGAVILVAIGIKAGFPVLHAWLPDTYPAATIVGGVVLSAFTTKFAIYVLARGFAGTEILVWIGVVMACFPIFYAVIENDLRRVLAYSMINQLGFMVVGIGIGGALGVNGAAAHAFADIMFKGLLFMCLGAVLLRTGTVNGSELGGLYKSMPQTTVLCIIGAASISAFPLFSAFTTKTMIMEAAAVEHRTVIWLLLLFASAGVFHHAGIKIPFFAFFAHDRGIRVAEAPLNMRVSMLIAAGVSMAIGIAPGWLYAMLPFPVDYSPYTTAHVVNQLQLLVFAALAFVFLMRTGLYPPELRSVNLDADVVYRKALPSAARAAEQAIVQLRVGVTNRLEILTAFARACGSRALGPGGTLSEPTSTATMVLLVTAILGLVLALSVI